MLSLWLAPPLGPSLVREQAWNATRLPRSKTHWHMASGPSTAAWTRTGPPAEVAARSAAIESTRITPPEAVPMGAFTKAGKESQLSDPTEDLGWGMPRRVSVVEADTLSWTAQRALKSGTAVVTPAEARRDGAAASTATCSWVGTSRSKPPSA